MTRFSSPISISIVGNDVLPVVRLQPRRAFCYFFLSISSISLIITGISSVRNADRYSPFNVSTTVVLISSASAFGLRAMASRMADLIRV